MRLAVTPAAPVTVAPGLFGGYELDGDNFIIQRYAVSPNLEPLFEFCTLTRDDLGSPSTKLGMPGTESRLFSNSLHESHGAVVLSESEIGDAGTVIRPVLVNLDAPDKPLPLTGGTFPTIDEDGINFHIVD